MTAPWRPGRRSRRRIARPADGHGATVGDVSEGAGHRWRHAIDGRLSRLQQQDGRLGQLALLWISAVSVVLIACVAFFLVLYWMFG